MQAKCRANYIKYYYILFDQQAKLTQILEESMTSLVDILGVSPLSDSRSQALSP